MPKGAIHLVPSAAETTIGPIPAGFVKIAAAGLTGFDATSYTIHLGGESTQVAFISATTIPVGLKSAALLTIGTKLRSVKVRGKAGYVGHDAVSLAALGSFTQASVAWMETPTMVVSVQGSLTQSELLKIAKGLREVSETEWRKQMPE